MRLRIGAKGTQYNGREALATYDSTVTGTGGAAPITGALVGSHTHRRISWAAIFGAVVLVLSIQILLSLLGAGVGLGTVNVNAGSTPSASSFGIGAGLWWVLSSCIALFVGGYVAAWLAGNEIKFDGLLHGLVTWGISTIFTVYLLTTAIGGIIGGGFSAMSSAVSAAGGGIKSAAAPIASSVGISPDMVQQQAQAYLQPTNPDPATMSPQDAQKAVATDLVTYEQGGADAPAAKEQIIDITAAQMKISKADATKKFDDAQAKIQQTVADAKQKAADAADTASAGASKTSFGIFVDLLLGAVAAAAGGLIAIRRRVIEVERPAATRVVRS